MQNKEKKSAEYLWGYDAEKFGANQINCHFSIFSTPEKTKEWERGNKDAKKELNVLSQLNKTL